MTKAKKVHRVRWLGVAIIGLFIISMALPKGMEGCVESGSMVNIENNGRQLMFAMRIYATENAGKYPSDFKDLVASGVLQTNSSLERLLRSPWAPKPLGWLYFSGCDDKTPPEQPILASPVLVSNSGRFERWIRRQRGLPSLPAPSPMRIVLSSDSAVKIMEERDFQKLLADKHLALPLSYGPSTAP